MAQQTITMKDIAKALGVSVATVSRALSGVPGISEERRKLIEDYAREHDFVPNIIAENLRNSKVKPQKIIGVILPEFVHFFFSSILSGIEKYAAKHGYFILAAQSLECFECEKAAVEAFTKARVCGIIVSQAKDTTTYGHWQKLLDSKIPLVFVDRICTGVDASRVVIDDYHGAYMATSHLIETGCRRIAFCGRPMHLEIVKNRLNGYKDALIKHGLEPQPGYILECDNGQIAEEFIPQFMESFRSASGSERNDKSGTDEAQPDGFFAINDDTAIGIVHALKHMGYRIPDDIGVCGFTNGQRALACDPKLTTIDQRGEEIGKQAVDILIQKLDGVTPLDRVEKRIVRTKLIIRGTTRQLTTNN